MILGPVDRGSHKPKLISLVEDFRASRIQSAILVNEVDLRFEVLVHPTSFDRRVEFLGMCGRIILPNGFSIPPPRRVSFDSESPRHHRLL